MAKQLNVSLTFTADTSQAKQQLSSLQGQLSSLINTTTFSGKGVADQLKIKEAIAATAELKSHLQAAVNVQTGNLDFSKLNESIRNSGKNLQEYGQHLQNLGPAGKTAFQTLANSVANSEMPLRRSNALLTEMWTSLKNTARWQISSSILHGFMGAVQQAYGYAQDLNGSLNDIRIVTGQSVDQMARFAEEANKSAKALSTTTTEYTKASLIYYQQGLSDEEVKARTDITIKMANAAGESAVKVSDQLTAVWNNFADGTKSLEYYADVMTALGAATASSTDEIAGGLEKFAAIGETIGLSYEYAASALATITSNTRQSEEVVGTALKTIFARIQGLELGDTLEDGLNLNKYSEALEKVGISIFDSTGELKKMDNILNEMAAKWDTLNKGQQTALAQTVAGVRQYTQLVALMENWDNGDTDSMTANLNTAYNSEGALQKQADIYAESWEAAQDRVRAATEAIYQDLLNDEFFIGMLNSLEDVLTFIDKFIDNIGGLGGVLTALGTIVTKVFHNQLAQGLQSAAYNMKMMTQAGQESLKQQRQSFIEAAANTTMHEDYSLEEEKARSAAMKDNLNLQLDLMESADRMSQVELETNKILIDRAKTLDDLKIKAAANVDKTADDVDNAVFKVKTNIAQKGLDNNKSSQEIRALSKEFTTLEQKLKQGITLRTNLPEEFREATKEGKSTAEKVEALKKVVAPLGEQKLTNFISGLSKSNLEGEQLEDTLAIIVSKVDQINNQAKQDIIDLEVVDNDVVDELTESLTKSSQAQKEYKDATEQSKEANETARESIEKSNGTHLTWADNLVNISNTVMGVATAIQSFNSIVKTIQDPNLSGWEKFSSILMSIGMLVPALASAFSKESIASLAAASAAISHALGLETEATAAGIATGATASFGTVLYSVLGPIALVVAAIAGLALGFKALSDAANADEIAAEKAAAAAGELAEGYETARTKADELMASVADYRDAENALNELTKGTKEYQDALIEANGAALELMQNNPGQFSEGVDYDWVDGKIEFKPEALERAERNAVNQANSGYAAAQFGTATATQARAEVEKNDVIALLEQNAGVTTSEISSQIQSEYNNVRSEASAAQVDTSVSSQMKQTQVAISRAMDVIVESYKTNPNILSGDEEAFTKQMQSLGIVNDDVITALYANRDAVEKSAQTYSTSVQQFEVAATYMANNLLTDPKIAQSDNKDAVLSKMTDEALDAYNTELQKLETNKWGTEGIHKGHGANQAAKDVFADYVTAAGLTGATLVDTTGSDANRMFKYDDGSGEIKEVSLEAMKVAVAMKNAEGSISGTANKLTTVVDSLDAVSTAYGEDSGIGVASQGMKAAFLDGDFSEFTMDELTGLSELDVEGYLTQMFGENYETKLQEIGYDSADDFITAFSEGVTAAQEEFNTAIESLGENSPLKSMAEGASTEAVSSLVAQTNRATQIGGEEGGQAFQNNLNDIIGTVDPSKQQEAFEALSTVDWSQAGASEEAIQALGRLGIKSEETREKIMSLTGEMRELNGANLDDLNTALDADIETEEYEQLADFLQTAAENSKDFSEDLQYNETAAKKTAEAILRFNNAIQDVNENYENWNYALKQGSVQDQAKAVGELRDAYADMLNVDMSSLSNDFITNTDNLELMKQAAAGSEEAYQKLQEAAGKDILASIGLDTSQYDTNLQSILSQSATINDQKLADLEAGASLDNTAFLDSLTDIVNQADMTAQEATDYLASMGIDAEVVTDTENVTDTSQMDSFLPHLTWKEHSINLPDILGGTKTFKLPSIEWISDPATSDTNKQMTAMGLKVKSATKASGGNIKHKHSTTGGGTGGANGPKQSKKTGGGGGGGSSGGKTVDKVKKSDIVDRYKEIEDKIDDVKHAADLANESTDALYGSDKAAAIRKQNQLIGQEIDLLKQKREEALRYLDVDKKAMEVAAQKVGLTLEYDDNGNLSNYTEQMSHLTDQLNAIIDAANKDGKVDEAEKKQIETLKAEIKELEAAIRQYEATLEEIEKIDKDIAKADSTRKKNTTSIQKATSSGSSGGSSYGGDSYSDTPSPEEIAQEAEDAAREAAEAFEEWQNENYERLNFKLEMQIEINEDELRMLDYYLNKISDDFYQMAESAAIMMEKVDVSLDSLGDYSDFYSSLDSAYASGAISQEAYVEGLGQCLDGIYDNLEAIMELDKAMLHYYGDTLQAAGEEIDKITDQLANQTAILDHYKTMLDLMGKSTDYDKIGTILEGQAETTYNEMVAARGEYEMYAKEAEEMYLKWQSAENAEQAELYKNQYDAALAASTEAQSEYLAKAEQYGEALGAILENSLNKYAQDLENALTGGTSFDQITTQMQRAAALQEEYLTTTNKIYETNKLMNQAQQQIDQSTSTIAKQRLKQFIDETLKLQEKTQLSQFELEIQQAKYDLLLAEIALEEAQAAKSQVSLQRDSEGNFGYVYTADATQVSTAEQQLADAQNNLYNIALEGANGYAEKYQQILAEMYDTLTQLQLDYQAGAFESEEEYEAAVLAAKEYYFGQLETYSHLYHVALEADSAAAEEAWSQDFDSMILSSGEWKDEVEKYVQDVKTAFDQWGGQMSQLASDVGLGGDLSRLSEAVSEVTKTSEELVDMLTKPGGVLDAIQSEIDAVSQLTEEYASQRRALLETARAYEQLAQSIMRKRQAEMMSMSYPSDSSSSSSSSSSRGSGSGSGSGGSGYGGSGGSGSKGSGKTSGGDGKISVGDTATLSGSYYYDSYGENPAGSKYSGVKDGVQVDMVVGNPQGGQDYYVHIKGADGVYSDLGWVKASQLSGYDTGGYTGEWGPYGKLALLHEKELVLNAKDTENFLSGMEFLNNIVSTIDLYTANSQIGGLMASPGFRDMSTGSLEQKVTIEANFPGVSSRVEIEEAFNTLVNRASQYANRK